MGSSTSKAAKTAANATKRQYPQRIPQNPPPISRAPPHASTTKPRPQASSTRDEAIVADGKDPDFARSLRTLGPVQTTNATHPTTSTSYTQQAHTLPSLATNPALQVLAARSRLAEAAEREFAGLGLKGFQGKEFLDVEIVKQALLLRDQGVEAKEIERRLELKDGVVRRLGRVGLVSVVD